MNLVTDLTLGIALAIRIRDSSASHHFVAVAQAVFKKRHSLGRTVDVPPGKVLPAQNLVHRSALGCVLDAVRPSVSAIQQCKHSSALLDQLCRPHVGGINKGVDGALGPARAAVVDVADIDAAGESVAGFDTFGERLNVEEADVAAVIFPSAGDLVDASGVGCVGRVTGRGVRRALGTRGVGAREQGKAGQQQDDVLLLRQRPHGA
jgi:hypothetical protein